MLLIMAAFLAVLTFFIWTGFPIFIIGSSIANLTTNLVIIHFFIAVSGGLLFSLFFLPINLKVAKRMAEMKRRSVLGSFIRLETMWILGSSLIYETILVFAIQR
jgi:hypothetical protein